MALRRLVWPKFPLMANMLVTPTRFIPSALEISRCSLFEELVTMEVPALKLVELLTVRVRKAVAVVPSASILTVSTLVRVEPLRSMSPLLVRRSAEPAPHGDVLKFTHYHSRRNSGNDVSYKHF